MLRMSKRIVLGAYDAFCLLVVAFVFSCAFVQPAFAYVDPSVMTYAIQAIAGVAVALSTVLGVAFRRTRKKIMQALGIDENARKQREGRVHRVDDQGNVVFTQADRAADYQAAGNAAQANARRASRIASTASWKRRLVLALLVSLFFSITVCLDAPLEIVAGSQGSLVVGLGDVWGMVALFALAVTAVLTAVLTLLRGRAFDIGMLVVAGLALGCYVQALFMNGGLPQADGGAIDWGSYSLITVVSAAVWLVVLVGPQISSYFRRTATRTAACVVSAALVIVQAVGVASLFMGSPDAAQPRQVITQQGLYDVSSKSNVVEFVLDTYDTRFLEEAVTQQPDLLNDFTGFTWCTNSVGSMIPTRYGNVFLLTGNYPREDENFSTFLKERYQRSTYLASAENAGYDVGLYTDTLGDQYLSADAAEDLIYRHTENIHQLDSSAIDVPGALGALMQCALYRDVPWVLKPTLWFYTDDINNRIVAAGAGDDAKSPYLMNDAHYYATLKERGLQISDDGAGQNGSYRYIHLLGAHDPFNLSADGQDLGLNQSTREAQDIASMRMVAEYIRQLKELGVYDQTTIIVTADHGDWYSTMDRLTQPTTPIVLVKPAQSAEADGVPLVRSTVPVSASNVVSTALWAMGADTSGYEKPISQLDAQDNEVRRFYMTESNGVHDQYIRAYDIVGDANQIADWQATDTVWAAQE